MKTIRTRRVASVKKVMLISTAPRRFGASWIKEHGENALKVARHLGGQHEEVVSLALQDKNVRQIARKAKLSESIVSAMVKALDAHVRFYNETGNLPKERNPTVESWRLAKKLARRMFPMYIGAAVVSARRAIALGLSGVLPTGAHSIYLLRRAVKRREKEFPIDVVDALKTRPRDVEFIEAMRGKIQIAANRGDKAAQNLLDSNRSGLRGNSFRTGGSLWRRHPDLVMGTALQPDLVNNVHPASLATRKHIVNALALRGETAGKAMQLLIAGKNRSEIAEQLDRSRSRVKHVLAFGTSAVFGIPPKDATTQENYYRLRRRHKDLFQSERQKRKNKQKEAA
ncbi:MAG: hypothetical protein V1722_02320 [Candidatus Micrarchaeota archaeon]